MIVIIILPIIVLSLSQQSSQGILSSSVADLGSEIKDFSSQSSSSFSSLNAKLEAEQDYIADASEYLISSKTYELNSQLDIINANIETIDAALSVVLLECDKNFNCTACTFSQSCIWCTVEKMCVYGDSQGPINGECSEFLYDICSYPGCEEYQDCETCISDTSCGWCSIGHMCYEATSVLKGDCEFEHFYHSEGNTQCPAYTPRSKGAIIDTEIALQEEKNKLLSMKNEIELEIEYLEEIRKDIVAEASKTITIPSGIQGEDYTGIVDVTDQQAEIEKENKIASEQAIWDNWANQTEERTKDLFDEEYTEIIKALQNYEINVEYDTQEIEAETSAD